VQAGPSEHLCKCWHLSSGEITLLVHKWRWRTTCTVAAATTASPRTVLHLLALFKHTNPIVIDDRAEAVCDCKNCAPVKNFTDHLLDLGIGAHVLGDTYTWVSSRQHLRPACRFTGDDNLSKIEQSEEISTGPSETSALSARAEAYD
jgi:hypothetical protein